MALELPGFYFDQVHNRYFPKSSQSRAPELVTPPSDSELETDIHEGTRYKTQHSPWRFQQTRLTSSNYTKILRESHLNTGYHYAHSTFRTCEKLPTFGSIRSICCANVGGKEWRIVGDTQGWLYSDKELTKSDNVAMHYWSGDWCLRPSSPITSIAASDSRFISTCLGPGKMSVQDLHCPERIFLLNLHGVKDIRASHVQEKEVLLGAKSKVVYIEDIDNSTSPRHIYTKSDVFSVLQRKHLMYAGERNGTVERFDNRTPSHQSVKLFDDRFGSRPRSTVLKLDIVQEHELFLSHLNGDLALYDLRFSPTIKAEPITVFEGHVNSYLDNLGIAIDPSQEFLFAAGRDNRLRIWSLRSGLPVISGNVSDSNLNPFTKCFPAPISALHVTRDPTSNEISLWAAQDRDLWRFQLGQRSQHRLSD